jgi:glycosyltransferase involved in cell wall biosynthesis
MPDAQPHIVSFVFNKVEGDSRVIRTAQAALKAGYRATIVGVTSAPEPEEKTIDDVPVLLAPNPSKRLQKNGVWGPKIEAREMGLLMGGLVQWTLPHVVRLNPDLLHSHDMFGLKLGAAVQRDIALRGVKIPWVHDLHEFVAGLKGHASEAYMPTFLQYEQEYLHKADHLITVSEGISAEVSSRYGLKKPLQLIYNTPRYAEFSDSGPDIRSTLKLSPAINLVVFIGRATELRGCHTIVDAVKHLPDVHLAFVSGGAYVEDLVEKAKKAGFGDRVHLHPYVASSEVTSFIRTANVGIHGMVHYPNGEVALPNKMFEYMHAGLPLAVSDVAGMKGFVERHEIGLSFEAENPQSCAATIRKLLEHEQELKGKITEELKQEYSWEKQEEKLRQAYSELLALTLDVTDAERRQGFLDQRLDQISFDAAYARAVSEARSPVFSSLTSNMKKVLSSLANLSEAAELAAWFPRRARGVATKAKKMIGGKGRGN